MKNKCDIYDYPWSFFGIIKFEFMVSQNYQLPSFKAHKKGPLNIHKWRMYFKLYVIFMKEWETVIR